MRVNKSLLIGKKLKKYFAGFGGAIGTVTDYLLDHDAYRLEYSDGHVDIIPFDDILKLLPKSSYFAQKGGARGQKGEGTHGKGREHVK